MNSGLASAPRLKRVVGQLGSLKWRRCTGSNFQTDNNVGLGCSAPHVADTNRKSLTYWPTVRPSLIEPTVQDVVGILKSDTVDDE